MGRYPELIEALEACTLLWPERELYTQFFDPKLEVRMCKEWPLAGGLTLECSVDGELLIDLVRHHTIPSRLAIFGMEYMHLVLGHRGERAPKRARMTLVNRKYRGSSVPRSYR